MDHFNYTKTSVSLSIKWQKTVIAHPRHTIMCQVTVLCNFWHKFPHATVRELRANISISICTCTREALGTCMHSSQTFVSLWCYYTVLFVLLSVLHCSNAVAQTSCIHVMLSQGMILWTVLNQTTINSCNEIIQWWINTSSKVGASHSLPTRININHYYCGQNIKKSASQRSYTRHPPLKHFTSSAIRKITARDITPANLNTAAVHSQINGNNVFFLAVAMVFNLAW